MWRGDEQIDELKRETRERIAKKLEPTNYFDVLFIVEHPAFAEFYDELLDGGSCRRGRRRRRRRKNPAGDLEIVELRDGYEAYDFAIPMIVRDAEEELKSRRSTR